MIASFLRLMIDSLSAKSLPIFEVPGHSISSARIARNTAWSAFASAHPDLRFTGMQLAHAVVKADHLDYANPTLPGIGFLLQSHRIIDWSSPQLCLRPGASTLLTDFVRTSMAGRIGQGLALLFMQSKGYAQAMHLHAYLESMCIRTSDGAGRRQPVADFLCEGPAAARALAESKASFAKRTNEPSEVKQRLKSALVEQVEPWMGKISPPATKGFVIATYLRECSDSSADDSALVFVDPEDQNGSNEVEVPSVTVRRENYAAWLSAMGLQDAGARLRDRRIDEGRRVTFAVIDTANGEFAFPSLCCIAFPGDERPSISFDTKCMAAGIEFRVLRAIAQAVQGDEAALVTYQYQYHDEPLQARRDESKTFSIFPDGTFLGTVDFGQIVRIEEFVL